MKFSYPFIFLLIKKCGVRQEVQYFLCSKILANGSKAQ